MPVQVSATHSGLPNSGDDPVFSVAHPHAGGWVAVARVVGTAWSQTLPVSSSGKEMVFKHLPLSAQLFTWRNDNISVSILLAVPSFLEGCLHSSCRSCLLSAWAIAHSLQVSSA